MFKLFLLYSFRLIALGLVVIYLTLVAIALRSEGAHLKLRMDKKDPLQSLDRLLVWTGVKLAAMIGRLLRGAFDELICASAELGEWVLHLSGHNVQARYHSR